MKETLEIKAPDTSSKILEVIEKRWSPLAFDDSKEVSVHDMERIFEAARWAASAFNEQPWSYAYAFKGTEGFEELWDCLNEGNQPWTKTASVIMVSVVKTTFKKNGKNNPWARHDVGMANAHILLQSTSMDIYGHYMAGYDTEKISKLLNLSSDEEPVCMGVFGYLGDPEQLDENYRERELSSRQRKEVADFTKKL